MLFNSFVFIGAFLPVTLALWWLLKAWAGTGGIKAQAWWCQGYSRRSRRLTGDALQAGDH